MKIKDITAYLEVIAPNHYQESYDNAGLIVGHPNDEVEGLLICLDSTEAVIDEAIKTGCNLVIAHHPIVFRGMKRFNGYSYIERVVIKAIKNDIAIYAIHTNLDNVQQGVNARIAERIGLKKPQILLTKRAFSTEKEIVGSGMIGELERPMGAMDFLNYLKEVMEVNCIKYTNITHENIQKIAVCGGAGGFLLQEAIAQNAHVFITSDYKYHEFFDADGHIIIADIGHYESEQFTIDLLFEIIKNKFTTFAVRKTTVNTNPVNYL